MEAESPAQDEQLGRFCTDCLEWKPIEQFRFRNRKADHRHHQCNACAAKYRRELNAHNRREALDNSLVNVRYHRESPGNLEFLATTLLKVFGGAIGYANEYLAAFDAARDANDHKAVQRYIVGLTDFCFAADLIKARRAKEENRRQQRAAQARLADRRNYDYEDDLWS